MFTTKFCFACGVSIDARAEICPKCGVRQPVAVQDAPAQAAPVVSEISEKKVLPAFILCFFLGFIGMHYFYVGRKVAGFVFIALAITGYGLILTFLIAFFDLFALLFGRFKDKEEKNLVNWG